MLTITLPDWMVHRIAEILSKHRYTGSFEISQKIKEQVENNMIKE